MITKINIKDNSLASKKDYSWNEIEVKALRKLIEQENLIALTDDTFLLAFLRAKKFDRERAFKSLKHYYSNRRNHPSFFKNFAPSTYKEVLDYGILGYFQHTDLNGRVLGYGKASLWDPSKISVDEILKIVMLFLDLLINEHIMQVNGLTIFIDTAGISWRHCIQFTPRVVYKIVSFALGYPIRYKEVHLLNVNNMVHTIVAVFLPFLPHKLRQRIHLHSNVSSLHKFIHPKYLPSQFGGELPPFDATEAVRKLKENEELFIRNEKYWQVDQKMA